MLVQSQRDTNLPLLERTVYHAVILPISDPQNGKKLMICSRNLELEISEVMLHWKTRILDQVMAEKLKNRGLEKLEFGCTEITLQLSPK